MSQPDSINVIKALLYLKGVSLNQAARICNVQAENLRVWLHDRVHGALNPKSYRALFGFLGIENRQFSDNYVHYWSLDVKKRRMSAPQIETLTCLHPFLAGGQICELRGIASKYNRKTRYFMLRTKSARILLSLRGNWLQPHGITAAEFPGVQVRSLNGMDKPVCTCTKDFESRVFARDLSVSEFDDLFLDTHNKVTWDNLRLISNANHVTPTQIASWILKMNLPADVKRLLSDTTTVDQLTQLDLGSVGNLPKDYFQANLDGMANAFTHADAPVATAAPKASQPAKPKAEKPQDPPKTKPRATRKAAEPKEAEPKPVEVFPPVAAPVVTAVPVATSVVPLRVVRPAAN